MPEARNTNHFGNKYMCDQSRVKSKMYAKKKENSVPSVLSISTSVVLCKEKRNYYYNHGIFTIFIILRISLFNPISLFVLLLFLLMHILFCLPFLYWVGNTKGPLKLLYGHMNKVTLALILLSVLKIIPRVYNI